MVICKLSSHKTKKYKTSNPKKDPGFLIWFVSDYLNSLLYLVIENIYLLLFVEFVSQLTMMSNQKLHTEAFCKLFCLVPSFELPPPSKIQSCLPVFYEPLPNPRKLLTKILQILNAPSTPHALSPSCYMSAEIAVMDDTITAVRPAFEKKASEVENKYMRHHAQMFAKVLDLLGVTYLRKHKLTSIASVI